MSPLDVRCFPTLSMDNQEVTIFGLGLIVEGEKQKAWMSTGVLKHVTKWNVMIQKDINQTQKHKPKPKSLLVL